MIPAFKKLLEEWKKYRHETECEELCSCIFKQMPITFISICSKQYFPFFFFLIQGAIFKYVCGIFLNGLIPKIRQTCYNTNTISKILLLNIPWWLYLLKILQACICLFWGGEAILPLISMWALKIWRKKLCYNNG